MAALGHPRGQWAGQGVLQEIPPSVPPGRRGVERGMRVRDQPDNRAETYMRRRTWPDVAPVSSHLANTGRAEGNRLR